jgi:predicted metalloprotease with PDZ domain
MTRLFRCRVAATLAVALAVWARVWAQGGPSVVYTVTFPEPEHHWLQVEIRFTDLEDGPLRARMSRSSPGRYAVHEFAKNVFWIEAYDAAGAPLGVERSGVDEWRVDGHRGTVRLVYRLFGDHPDGTYMAVDTTHAHLNMPATFLWGVGLESRPIRITFVPPAESGWTAGTQLFPTADALTFTAPNLQYFMDSPTELARFVTSTFTVPGAPPARFRVMVHGDGSQADVDGLASLVERLAGEHRAVFGEFPAFENGTYTFLLDYVPWAESDAMEHRNSTMITDPNVSLRTPEGRREALDSISHEFFHAWNVERIRPHGLEPFDFTRQNVTCCLWLGEGFTSYYGPLLLLRAGLGTQLPLGSVVSVINGSGRHVRSAVQMSEHAPFADAAVSVDLDDRSRTFISYYTHGAALALGLDLALRERSNHAVSLDDYMRALWREFGAVNEPRTGYVARPYTLGDLRRVLAAVANDDAFANEFFDRYVEGRDVMDYARLLALGGYELRRTAPDRGWIGAVEVQEDARGLTIGGSGWTGQLSLVPFNTPAYRAGLDHGDLIRTIDGERATLARWRALTSRKPGDQVRLEIERRGGSRRTLVIALEPDPSLQVLPMEMLGSLSPAQQAFRQQWVGTKQ